MKLLRIIAFLVVSFCVFPVVAGHITLSAQWDGSEEKMATYEGTCHGAGDLGYSQFNAIQVSSSGEYLLADASDSLPGDVMVAIYEGSFDPDAPESNLIDKFDQGGRVSLLSGQDYIVVVQHWCRNIYPATFGVSLFGEGDISGVDVVASPDWTRGGLSGSNPIAMFEDISRHYAISGLQMFPATGLYHFADISLFDRLDTEVRVYEGFFNPFDTEENLITSLDDAGGIALKAGINYQFVITARIEGNTGDWLWVLFPPGSQQLNAGLSGSWFNPATRGQGILIDVMPEQQLVSLAWFTFDMPRPDVGPIPVIGGEGQRWLTALGPYQTGDNSVVLNIQNTTGGEFDSGDPAVDEDEDYGTIVLQFSDCLNATMTYELLEGSVSNEVPITRIVYDHLPLCANLGSLNHGVITN